MRTGRIPVWRAANRVPARAAVPAIERTIAASANRERGPRNSVVNAHPRHRPERHQHVFVESEAARDQDDRADRADRLKWRRDPGLVVKFGRALVEVRVVRLRRIHQLSICSFSASKVIRSTPSCCNFAWKVGDSPPTTRDGVGDDVEFRADSYQRGDLAVDACFGVHAVHHDVVVGAQDEPQDGAQVRVVGQLFELLSSKNDLARRGRGLSEFRRACIPGFPASAD